MCFLRACGKRLDVKLGDKRSTVPDAIPVGKTCTVQYFLRELKKVTNKAKQCIGLVHFYSEKLYNISNGGVNFENDRTVK
jgi:hypothetical protein